MIGWLITKKETMMGKRLLSAVIVVVIVSLLTLAILLAIGASPVFEGQTVLQAKLYFFGLYAGWWIQGPVEVVSVMMTVIVISTNWIVRRKNPDTMTKRLGWSTFVGALIGLVFGFLTYAVLLAILLPRSPSAEFSAAMAASLAGAGLIIAGPFGGFLIEVITIVLERRGLKDA